MPEINLDTIQPNALADLFQFLGEATEEQNPDVDFDNVVMALARAHARAAAMLHYEEGDFDLSVLNDKDALAEIVTQLSLLMADVYIEEITDFAKSLSNDE